MTDKPYIDKEQLYLKFKESIGVSTDTRTLSEGQLFFALKGPNFDGNSLAAEAIESGAIYAVIDNPDYAVPGRTLLVPDTLKALQEVARLHRTKQNIPVIGITGSNGKTTTKELIYAVLSSDYNVHCTKGNYNNHIGVPLTILNAVPGADLWLIEMGTNQPGDIAFLCEIAQPNFGLITNIGMAHLEKLINLEGVFKEKTALFDSVIEKNGLLFINQSDPYLTQYKTPKLSENQRIDYKLDVCPYGKIEEDINNSGLLSLVIADHVNGENHSCPTHLYGSYNKNNIAAALTIGAHFSVKLKDAIKAISGYVPTNMRSQQVQTAHNTVVIDGYNANPSSMRASLGAFVDNASDNAIAIIGDMLELGEEGPKYHQEIIQLLNKARVDYYLVGPIFSKVSSDTHRSFSDVTQLLTHLKKEPLKAKEVFIKASRGIRLEKLLDVL